MAGLFDGGPEIRVLDRLSLQQVHAPAEQAFEVGEEPEERLGMPGGWHGLELDQEIEVAPRRLELVAGPRAEQVEARYEVLPAEGSKLGKAGLDLGMHGGLWVISIADLAEDRGRL